MEALILDVLQWLATRQRSYEEVMEAWRTSCPKLPRLGRCQWPRSGHARRNQRALYRRPDPVRPRLSRSAQGATAMRIATFDDYHYGPPSTKRANRFEDGIVDESHTGRGLYQLSRLNSQAQR